MNVTDITADAPEVLSTDVADRPELVFRVRDMLETMMQRQYELEAKYEDIERANGLYVPVMPVDLDDARSQWFLKDAAYRCIEELSEATNCLKNKPWKTTQVPTDQVHFIEELADATHFFIRIWLYLYGNPKDAAEAMYKTYFKKSEVNKFRQATNY